MYTDPCVKEIRTFEGKILYIIEQKVNYIGHTIRLPGLFSKKENAIKELKRL